MKVPVIDMSGSTVGEIELNPAIFEASVNVSLMHQALMRQLANARQGNAKTKKETRKKCGCVFHLKLQSHGE